MLVLWNFTEVNSSMIGKWKTHVCEELKGFRDFSILQASTQALTPVDPGDFVKITCWEWHSIDGSPSLGKEQATGRVDVPVGATKLLPPSPLLIPLCNTSPQCVVFVHPVSHVEKKEKTVFVKGVEGRSKVRRVLDSTQIWELLDDGIDMWAAVNGKMVDMHDTMANIGIHDQDTIRCCGKLRGGAQRFRQPPQDILGVIHMFMPLSSVRLEDLHRDRQQQTRLSGPMVAKTRSLVSKRPLRHHRCSSRLCPSSHRLRVLEPIMLSRGLQVCVSTWRETY